MKKKKKVEENQPVWNLSKFYSGLDDPNISSDKRKLQQFVNDLIYSKDELPKMKAFEFLQFIRKYEEIVETASNLTRFASLNLCTQRDNQEALLFEKEIHEFTEQLFEKIQWLHASLYSLDETTKIELLQSPKLKNYQDWLIYQFLLPPALSEEVSKAVNKMKAIGNDWHSLYKQITSKLIFTIENKNYTLDEISNLAHCSKDKKTRDTALKTMSDEFKRYGYLFAQTLNSIYKKENAETDISLGNNNLKFDALDLDAFGNDLTREKILAFTTAVTDSYKPISQRFYKLLAKMLKEKRFDYNDRLQNPIVVTEKKIPFPKCLEIVTNNLMAFNPLMGLTGISIIEGELIHAKPMPGKESGAFCISGDKPYIFLNYRENQSSVLTFAHEFGHAIHHLYSHDTTGLLNNQTTIAMSEVASLFNEKLIFNSWLSNPELSNKEKLYLLIEDVNRQIADIHRQIAFSKFEVRAFRERQKGELSEERFTQIYSEEMERYLGFPLQEDAKFSWMAIPHLFNSPFYVRYYAFAGMVVNKLWTVFVSQEFDEDFSERYINMLSNTGIEDIEDLLEPFNLDMETPDFWTSALDPISAQIDEIERLAKAEDLL